MVLHNLPMFARTNCPYPMLDRSAGSLTSPFGAPWNLTVASMQTYVNSIEAWRLTLAGIPDGARHQWRAAERFPCHLHHGTGGQDEDTVRADADRSAQGGAEARTKEEAEGNTQEVSPWLALIGPSTSESLKV